MGSLRKIDHIVVLMLENRSFDCILGQLYPKSDRFHGLQGNETNPDKNGAPIQVWSGTGTDRQLMQTPDPDPGELWMDMNLLISGTSEVADPRPEARINGLVLEYLQQTAELPDLAPAIPLAPRLSAASSVRWKWTMALSKRS